MLSTYRRDVSMHYHRCEKCGGDIPCRAELDTDYLPDSRLCSLETTRGWRWICLECDPDEPGDE